MKQSFDSVFAIEDIEVANIMLELPRFSCTWGCRRKRSVCTSSPPPSKQPLPSSTVVGPIEKVLSSSPDTPLSFCSNEADEKSLPLPPKKKASSVNSLKRKKEQFLETVEDFTHRNEILKKDIEIKRQLLDRQIAENLELKSKKLKLNQSLLTPETHKSLNLGIQSTQMSVGQHHQQQGIPSRVHHQPLMMDQMVQMISLLPSSNSIPDLNVSAEEAFIDLDIVNKSRAAAEARFKRKQICRAKNFKSLYKAGCPLT
ncbi:hypothetical protein ERO13_A06G003900v2 [Gossypium hirsutum]|uniref:Uncharacterized protein n=1 Tax=Gossypium hirsutum TaxID=3635 RepID=A0A1U8MIS9_GOSHI|nr:uncharacterized protein LOC107938141 [Gossypium hirsutum]KAG4193656.1 hypothetical protein ERO13_A06G003900v2 [Gossypium hirsutum]